MVMDGDARWWKAEADWTLRIRAPPYPAAKVARVLHDGDQVKLGNALLVAHRTAGHTRGCTTWTLKVKQGSVYLNAVIVGSWNVNPGYRLVDKPGQVAS